MQAKTAAKKVEKKVEKKVNGAAGETEKVFIALILLALFLHLQAPSPAVQPAPALSLGDALQTASGLFRSSPGTRPIPWLSLVLLLINEVAQS